MLRKIYLDNYIYKAITKFFIFCLQYCIVDHAIKSSEYVVAFFNDCIYSIVFLLLRN